MEITIMNAFYSILALSIAINIAWAFNCADGSVSSACNTCTNGACVCPGLQRNGMPCSKASDVTFRCNSRKKKYFPESIKIFI